MAVSVPNKYKVIHYSLI